MIPYGVADFGMGIVVTYYQSSVVSHLARVPSRNIELANELIDVRVYGHGGYRFSKLY